MAETGRGRGIGAGLGGTSIRTTGNAYAPHANFAWSPAADIAVKDRPVLLSDVASKQVADCLPVDAGTCDLKVRVAGADTIALEVTGLALQNRVVYTVFATGIVGGEPPLMAMPSPDAQHSVLPWTGGLAIASLCLPLTVVIGAMIVLGGLALHRQSMRSK